MKLVDKEEYLVLYTITSEKDFSQVITDVKQALSEIKIGDLWEMDIPSKLKEKGVDYAGQYRVLEVCNPQEAKKALETNVKVGYFLPCKIVIYVENGSTKVGMVRPTALVQMLGSELADFADGVEMLLVSAINKAK